MADPQPLTEAQLKQRDELNAQAAAYEQAQAEDKRKATLASLSTVDTLVKLLDTDKVAAAFDAAINSPDLDFENKARVQSLKASMRYNLDVFIGAIAAVQVPPVTPKA